MILLNHEIKKSNVARINYFTSMYFFALSHAPPVLEAEIATYREGKKEMGGSSSCQRIIVRTNNNTQFQTSPSKHANVRIRLFKLEVRKRNKTVTLKGH